MTKCQDTPKTCRVACVSKQRDGRSVGIWVEKRWVNPAYRQNSVYTVVLSISPTIQVELFETSSMVDAMKYACDCRDNNGLEIFIDDRCER